MPEVSSELYKLIKVGGSDAREFLQGQLTQDVGRLGDTPSLLAAWCNPKGRVIVVLRLLALDDAIGLIVPAGLAERIIQRLTMYRLRADVSIELSDEDATAFINADERDPTTLIQNGVPVIDHENSEPYTPHMLNLDKLDAISFTKGCYTGQEVVARTEHLGKSKRRLMRYKADGNSITVGDKLSDGERNVGEIVNVAGHELLAVTPVELHRQKLQIGDVTVSPQGLPYEL